MSGVPGRFCRCKPKSCLALLLIAFIIAPGAAAGSRSFVVSYFYPANYFSADTCPKGLNPLPDVFFKRDLKILGLPQVQIDDMFNKDYNVENGAATTRWVQVVATRGNGKDNVYINPATVPDSKLLPAVGRHAFGFNLDGRGSSSPDSYEDPLTHERGVDNQFFRATGCIQAYKGNPPPQPPLEPEYRWEYARTVMGAWIVTITAADLHRDGDVEVILEQSMDPISTFDANAKVQADMTYRIDRKPASRNVLRGTLRNGVITADAPLVTMQCDSYIQPVYEFRQARLRLTIRPDGSLDGMLGGYQPWYPLYWSHAKVGYIDERGFGVDTPGLYYALRRHADAYPDPKSGENTAISAAYMLHGVPAFIDTSQPVVERNTEAVGMKRPPARKSISSSSEPEVRGNLPFSRRLSADQIRRVIADAFGPAIRVEGRFEPDLRDEGLFAIGASQVGVTAAGMEQYDAIARGVAAQVVSERHRRTLIPCLPAAATRADDACAQRFFLAAGPVLYRRPLSDEELTGAVTLAHAAAEKLDNFYSGLAISLTGMLESPQFIFRQQTAEPEPGDLKRNRLDAYSKASQLSFFLWNSGPDQQLLAAASSGKIHEPSVLAEEVERLLASPRLENGTRAFFSDMLQFELFDTLAKDSQLYPKWTEKVAQDAREQTLRTIVDLWLTQNGDYRDLYTTRKTFLTPLLGSIYQLPVAQNESRWQPYEFQPGDPRAGIHTHASFVALHSHEGLSSPTLRGKALREILLCQTIPAPPANVNFAAAQDTHSGELKTMRERLTAHRTDPTCAGCHKLMDPAGLSLENFDSDGGYRTEENGRQLDTSGELDGISFADGSGLGAAIRDNPATGACLVRRMYSYATGRAPARRDMPWIRFLEKSFSSDGYRARELMRRIATSENFYRVTPSHGGTLSAQAGKAGTHE